jgi:clan AA aspartic protease
MMSGTVNTDLEAVLRLIVRDVNGQPHDVQAVIDTGFNGFLTLPPPLIASLGLSWLCRQEGELADGSIETFDVYVATVEWDGQPCSIEVEAVDAQPLLGMSLMCDSELRVTVTPGGSVTIERVLA